MRSMLISGCRHCAASESRRVNVAAVQAAYRRRFLIDEGLHSERDAIDSGAQQGGQNFVGERAGGDLDGHSAEGESSKVCVIAAKEAGRADRGQERWACRRRDDGVEQGSKAAANWRA